MVKVIPQTGNRKRFVGGSRIFRLAFFLFFLLLLLKLLDLLPDSLDFLFQFPFLFLVLVSDSLLLFAVQALKLLL